MTEPAPKRNEASVAGFEKGVRGITPPSSPGGRKGAFLTDVIVELGFADRLGIEQAEDAARTSGKTVEQLLLDKGVIDENQLSLALAERNGFDHVDLEEFGVEMKAAECVTRSVADRCGAVPIAFSKDGALIAAVQDPFDSLAVRRLETATGRGVRPVIAAASGIRRLIERLPDEPAEPSPEEPEVPRIKSQRELTLEDPEGAEEDLASFDGLSMDLGPVSMAPTEPRAGEGDTADRGGGDDREERLARELREEAEKVAELERRLEEAVEAAEEATASSEKLRALRRVIAERRR